MTDSLNNEMWLPIKGYEGLYEVSCMGAVRSISREVIARGGKKRITSTRIIRPTIDKLGYCRLGLHRQGKVVLKLVHRIVASAFIPNPDEKPQVNHRDGNPSNNKVSNLEWVTSAENVRHSFDVLSRKPTIIKGVDHYLFGRTGKDHPAYGKKGRNHIKGETHFASKKVLCESTGVEYISIKAAADAIGASASCVSNVLLGKRNNIKGLIFKYLK